MRLAERFGTTRCRRGAHARTPTLVLNLHTYAAPPIYVRYLSKYALVSYFIRYSYEILIWYKQKIFNLWCEKIINVRKKSFASLWHGKHFYAEKERKCEMRNFNPSLTMKIEYKKVLTLKNKNTWKERAWPFLGIKIG